MYSKEERDRFRIDLKVRIYSWTVRLVRYLKVLSRKNERMVWSICDQLVRSGTSVGANYIEAIGSPTTKDFRNFLSHALKSCNESKYWLALIRDSELDNIEDLEWLLDESIEIANILGKSVSTMYKQN